MPGKAKYWNLQEHTFVKHNILKNYLDVFLRIMGSSWNKFFIIDGFAGKGCYEAGEEGSPLVILECCDKILKEKKDIQEIICCFIEKDSKICNLLIQNVKTKLEKYNSKIIVKIYKNTFEAGFNIFFDKYYDDLCRNPAFYFIDPFGYSHNPMRIMERIFSTRNPDRKLFGKPEILMNLMVRDLKRFVDNPDFQKHYIELFEIININKILNGKFQSNPNQPKEAIISEFYRENLKKKTNAEYTSSFSCYNPKTNQWVYDLIFATTHIKGLEVMHENLYKRGIKGHFKFDKRMEKKLRNQSSLDKYMFNRDQKEIKVEKWLTNHLIRGKKYTFDEIMEIVYITTSFVKKLIRDALRKLEKQKIMKINRVSSKLTGIDKLDEIILDKKTKTLDMIF